MRGDDIQANACVIALKPCVGLCGRLYLPQRSRRDDTLSPTALFRRESVYLRPIQGGMEGWEWGREDGSGESGKGKMGVKTEGKEG